MENVKIKVYSTPKCHFCELIKKYLMEKDVDFMEVDVSNNKEGFQEMVAKSGQMGVPVVEIGDQIIVGFDKNRIEELLK